MASIQVNHVITYDLMWICLLFRTCTNVGVSSQSHRWRLVRDHLVAKEKCLFPDRSLTGRWIHVFSTGGCIPSSKADDNSNNFCLMVNDIKLYARYVKCNKHNSTSVMIFKQETCSSLNWTRQEGINILLHLFPWMQELTSKPLKILNI